MRKLVLSLFILAGAALTACAPMQPVASMEKEVEKEKTAAKQERLPLEEMDADFLYLASQNAIKDGDIELAIDMLETVAAKDPEAIEPRLQLVELLLQYGQLDRAAPHIESLLAAQSLDTIQSERLQLLQARMYAGKGDPDAALVTLGKFLTEHPENLHARELQVRILASQNRINEAISALDATIRVIDSAELRLLQAQLLLNQGNREAAKTSLYRMQELAPGTDTPVLMLHSIAIMEGNHDQAEQLLRTFLADYPDAARVSDALGRLLTEQNRLAEAILLYRDRAARAGNDHTVLQTLGFLYLQHGDIEDAEKTFRRLLEMHPSDAGHFYLAASLEAQDRNDEAREAYEQISKNSALFTDAQVRLAGMEMRQGRPENAEKRLRELLKANPDKLEVHALLSSILLSRKQHQQLLDESEPLMARDDVPPQLLFNRAIAFEQMQNYGQVEAMLMRILEQNRNHSESLNFLGYVYAEQGIKLDEAEEMIRRALKQKPDDGYYLDSLAWVYYKRGDYAKALETQQKAVESVQDDPVIYEHLGDIHWRAGDEAAARQAWQKSIELKAENPDKLRKKIAGGLTAAE